MGTTAAKLEALLATKTDIKRAIEAKGQEVGDIPFSQYPAKIDAITTTPSPQPVGWQPNPTWWDIEKILEEDTEDIGTGGKCIFLLTDADIATTLNFSTWFYKIKTSDGAEYTANTTHTWDVSKNKQSSLGYSTRYVIGYTTVTDKDFGVACRTMFNRVCLYCVFDRCNFNGVAFGSTGSIYTCVLLQNVVFKNASGSMTSLDSAFYNCYSLTSITLPNTWVGVTNINDIFYNCFSLTSITLPDTWVRVIHIAYAFTNCYSLTSITLPNTVVRVTNINDTFYNCFSLTSITTGGEQFIVANFNIGDCYLNKKSLLEVISSLKDRTGTTTLHAAIGARHMNMLTPAEKLVATNKNWTLA